MTSKSAAVLWTGGKDCVLALHQAYKEQIKIDYLITFAPHNADFLAHPISVLQLQSEAVGIPHKVIQIDEPFKEEYEKAIRLLKEVDGIDLLISGDIDEVNSYPNWIKERSAASKMNVYTPLWQRDRKELLEELTKNSFKVIFSLVRRPWFTQSWVGDLISPSKIDQLSMFKELKGIDLAGEQGEYHTLVLDAPLFKKTLVIKKSHIENKEDMCYLKIEEIILKDK
ncbi:diphthine--ammonia ligase [Solitalea lacus]|uniref:Dph6-related ATP pyrophosphatase n=1 Tax=Solitalea lacus TaxID=2911172 RepID=UPI001EDBF2E1|nr:diphthine--ammonia ligase [Solitalea lacus]UKJ09155.1 diphthine--ammonia ligase [Solitalea lacus]